MRGLLPPPGGPSLQDARWGLANLARLLGVVWKWTPGPFRRQSGLLCQFGHPYGHRRDLLRLLRDGSAGSTMYLVLRTEL